MIGYGLVMVISGSHWFRLVYIGLSTVKLGSPETEGVNDFWLRRVESRE